ncbi:hypothetical protein, partial [Streptomyces sp. NPDC056982]|uniref:hypothetical protein n=1 Tax=Streptomyces sp. NPDC056982 TaxID=3345986 RepID=UPI0036D340B3
PSQNLRKGIPLNPKNRYAIFKSKKQNHHKAKAWQFITVRRRPLTEVQDELRLLLWLIVQEKN